MRSEQPMQQGVITVEVTLEDPEAARGIDIAFVGDMGREVVSQLEQSGYSVSLPEAREARKGVGELVVLAGYIVNQAWQHRQEIEQIVTISTGLYTLCQAVAGICRSIFHSHKKLEPTAPSCKITIKIDNASMTIEANDFPENDAAFMLAQRFTELHPTAAQRASTQSQVRVQNKVPNRTPGRRRGHR